VGIVGGGVVDMREGLVVSLRDVIESGRDVRRRRWDLEIVSSPICLWLCRKAVPRREVAIHSKKNETRILRSK
jgi:hypothetical protein